MKYDCGFACSERSLSLQVDCSRQPTFHMALSLLKSRCGSWQGSRRQTGLQGNFCQDDVKYTNSTRKLLASFHVDSRLALEELF